MASTERRFNGPPYYERYEVARVDKGKLKGDLEDRTQHLKQTKLNVFFIREGKVKSDSGRVSLRARDPKGSEGSRFPSHDSGREK